MKHKAKPSDVNFEKSHENCIIYTCKNFHEAYVRKHVQHC